MQNTEKPAAASSDPLVRRWMEISATMQEITPKATAAQALAEERLRVLEQELDAAQAEFGVRDLDGLRALYKQAADESKERLDAAQAAAKLLSDHVRSVMDCLQSIDPRPSSQG